MKEKKTRKEWIKTIAIVFLSVLLILTFFSNTIQNYSLPEVSAQYCYSGEVTSRVRGSGTVETADPYVVKAKGARVVESVDVAVGDEVTKGTPLFHLLDGESQELKDARKALNEARTAYETELISKEVTTKESTDIENNGTDPVSTYQNKLESAKKRVEGWENKVKQLELQKSELERTSASSEKENRKNINRKINELKEQLEKNKATLEEETKLYEEAKKATEDQKAVLADLQNKKDHPEDVSENDLVDIDQKIEEATALLTELETKEEEAKKSFEKAEKTKKNTEASLKNWEYALEDLYAGVNPEMDALLKQIDDANYNLDKAKTDYEELREDITTKLGLETLLENIRLAEEEVKYQETVSYDNAYLAPVDGTIVSIGIVSGETTVADSEVMTIQKAGKGFTLSMSVKNKQAALVKMGDEAEIANSWWYSDIHARVIKIAPDKNDPTNSKLITFEVEGDGLSSGQQLSISVGNRSANYDCVVPNSAIREDNNGKFILKVVSKDTPLGTRYYAERVDVTVLAEDDVNSAVSGNLDSWEFIITTTSKPVEAGQLVRLKDM